MSRFLYMFVVVDTTFLLLCISFAQNCVQSSYDVACVHVHDHDHEIEIDGICMDIGVFKISAFLAIELHVHVLYTNN